MSELQAARRASVWVLGLHTGGCSACAQSVAALEAPRYAPRLRALGVTFARTPRQSDILLLSGALTTQAQASVSALVEEAPRPRALVAIGDCAINGCVFAGSAQLTRPLAQELNVNVEIGGCPPTPQAIIEAIAEAQRLLTDKGSTPAATDAPAEGAETSGEASGEAPAPDRAARLSSLLAAADGEWDDDDNEANDSQQTDTIESDHLTGPRNGATRRAARQPEEKRSE
jgi:Ni,Fe-hydrogenase III small subunit